MIILLFGILGVLWFGVFKKELLKHNGEIVYLELSPVDPRSLIQGDYMQLSYRIERGQNFSDLREPKHIIVGINHRRVAHFERADDGGALDRDERRIRVKILNGHLRIVPRSFLFQEGQAKDYEHARYGVFRVDESGNHLLVDLADKQRELITPHQVNKS